MKVGRVTRLRSAPGRNCEMICESTGRLETVSSCIMELNTIPLIWLDCIFMLASLVPATE